MKPDAMNQREQFEDRELKDMVSAIMCAVFYLENYSEMKCDEEFGGNNFSEISKTALLFADKFMEVRKARDE